MSSKETKVPKILGHQVVVLTDELREKMIEHKNVATGNFLRKLEELAMEFDMDHFLYNKIRNAVRWENNLAINRQLTDLGFKGIVGLSRGYNASGEDGRPVDRPIPER
jgi:hypothetical protein